MNDKGTDKKESKDVDISLEKKTLIDLVKKSNELY